MKIVFIGNYLKDRQESMKRYTDMLYREFTGLGLNCSIWNPPLFFGSLYHTTNSGFGKWLGYIDKYILFPIIISMQRFILFLRGSRVCYHITDHSNAMYIYFLPIRDTVVTCHDVLAIRGAMGFEDAYCPASPTGVLLQKLILKSISKASKVVCVSNFTLLQLRELAGFPKREHWVVIHNPFNASFSPMNSSEASYRLSSLGIDSEYIFHLGSSLDRKNRALLVRMANILGDSWNGKIVFAGFPIDSTLQSIIDECELNDRVVSVVKPNHESLLALYSSCACFIFPSFSEGFGWPIIEAQSCGAPVLASCIEPMPEVGGEGALYADPNSPQEFSEKFHYLKNETVKSNIVSAGFKNVRRFSSNEIIPKYLEIYSQSVE
ncbi:glycosyltransferase family 4 protein [Algoriphagus oliviformis]|nr:glycosyltransferase family 1 protein [Algoriphagus oliviformis]